MAEKTVKEWEEAIRLAKGYQDESGRLARWKENFNYYDNKYPDGVISVNLIFAIGRALVPQLYFKTPTVLAAPRKAQMAKQARILEVLDNWLIDHIGMKAQLKLGILDAYRTNIAVFKFGYHSLATELPPTDDTAAAAKPTASMTEMLTDFLKDVLPGGAEPEPDTEEQKRRRYSYHDWVKPDAPWMLRVPPEDLLVPLGAVDQYAIPWCAFRVVRPLEDVKRDPVYSHTRNLKPNSKLGSVASNVMGPYEKAQVPKVATVELFEIWDKRDGRVRVIVEGHDDFLRNDKHGLDIEGLPVEVLQFNPNGRDFWGMADCDQIKAQVTEYNETRTLEILHKRTALTKFLFDENMIDDTELAKFTQGTIAAVKVKGPPQGAVLPLTPTMSRDLYNMSDVIRDDVREILGFSRNQVGEFEASRRTAAEATIVQGALQIRADERRDQIADLIAAAFQRKINPMIFALWDEERVIDVSALGGWQTYTGKQIAGDYDIKVIADSVVPLNRAQRQQTAMLAFTTLRGDPHIDQQRLYETVLEQFEDVLPQDLLLTPEQMQQQAQQQALAGPGGPGGGGPGGPGGPMAQAQGGGGNAQARPPMRRV